MKPSQEPAPTNRCGSTLSDAVEELERRMIQDALYRSAGNIARAARELGLSRKGLYLKIERLNFNLESVQTCRTAAFAEADSADGYDGESSLS
jgi:DNA-binding NtrC family response regulator